MNSIYYVLKSVSIFSMGIFYIVVGIHHFFEPEWYVQIVPPPLPFKLGLVYISGFFEILLGFILGIFFGIYTGILLILSKSIRKWMLPFIILTQAIPIFAIAPILTLWVGYGIWSKIIMTVLIIYFPITIAFYDGLKRIDPMIINLAKMMGANTYSMLIKIRIPFALPQLSSGLKLAAAFAPMGAVIGEWVGSSKGLGYLMLYASGRVQIDLMFSSIIILAFFTIILYNLVSLISNYITKWDPKSHIN